MPFVNNTLVQTGANWVIGVQAPKVGNTEASQIGVPNPYGRGASAYEPNTVIYDPSNDPLMRGSETQLTGHSIADENAARAAATAGAASGAGTVNTGGAGTPGASGSVLSFINAAKTMLGKPYVWGGTTSAGVDCSGLLYYAFNAAGIKMPRYRASDYGKMGQQVSADHALPGDIVYWDEPGDTDHVGIYLGNGLVLNSPHSGTVTQIDHVWGNPTYRRIIADNGFQQMAQPNMPPVLGYNGTVASRLFASETPSLTTDAQLPPSEQRLPTNGFRVRAI